jgi:hypothetical protein
MGARPHQRIGQVQQRLVGRVGQQHATFVVPGHQPLRHHGRDAREHLGLAQRGLCGVGQLGLGGHLFGRVAHDGGVGRSANSATAAALTLCTRPASTRPTMASRAWSWMARYCAPVASAGPNPEVSVKSARFPRVERVAVLG